MPIPAPRPARIPRSIPAVLAAALLLVGTACLPPPAPESPPALRAVRVGHHTTFDRVVLELDGDDLPAVDHRTTTGSVRSAGSGDVVAVAGAAAVVVDLAPAVAYDTRTWEPTYDGPHRLPVGGSATEAVFVSDFEGRLRWAVGTVDPATAEGVVIRTLRDPSRVVIDVPR